MNSPSHLIPILLVSAALFSFPGVTSFNTKQDFLQCLTLYSKNDPTIFNEVYTPSNSSYPSILQSKLENPRFNTTDTPKPVFIVTPTNESHIQATVYCTQKHGLQIRIRSGGHDYEGLSSRALTPPPFVIIDLFNLKRVSVDVTEKTAWVQAGATLGQVYYAIGQKSKTLAFPAGGCPTVGSGGHFSGGGYGLLVRKYGIAADNIIDAHLIDVNGRLLDRASMGEDLFWAIRGGGGNTFGIVTAWKINLVPVPPVVTIFSVSRTKEQKGIELLHRWQYLGSKLHEDLMILIFWGKNNSNLGGNVNAVTASFNTLFLGGVDRLLSIMNEDFPELGVVKEDCQEMTWLEAQISFAAGFTANLSTDVLLSNVSIFNVNFKGKSDFVTHPQPLKVIEEIWKRMEENVEIVRFGMTPFGGKMSEISESNVPYPHRAGILYKIGYLAAWNNNTVETAQRHINWLRSIYSYVAPYVSKNPRRAYVNYRDLDLGTNDQGYTSYKKASIWGVKYFHNNFDRLVKIKTVVDPTNYFRNEQTIPPFSY
ncbi:hypothetical protein K2173_000298 [Erythroxylum novogranatense]|uniref:FAD-binding PCMH-type domain-containing protein n=1 Tax=Erythroxylum novogranatense TaxID=1862640 RepID=A0AAV8SVX1_9ROSI|nr:hypothetical protein K2173_000298 [Erythroxylum novogranatense]